MPPPPDDLDEAIQIWIDATFAVFRLLSGQRHSAVIKAAKRRQKALGEFSGGRPPFGYVQMIDMQDGSKKEVLTEKGRQNRAKVIELHEQGFSLRRIAEMMTEGGVEMCHMTARKIVKENAPHRSRRSRYEQRGVTPPPEQVDRAHRS